MAKPKSDETIRITVSISGYEYRMLKYWSKIHAKPTATHASNILGSQVETNFRTINDQMKLIAEQEGISIEDLRKRWDEDD